MQPQTGQAIVNRCYEDPVSLNNPFCDAVFRRSSSNPIQNGAFNGQSTRRLENRQQDTIGTAGDGVGFRNSPFNFAALERGRGAPAFAAVGHQIGEAPGHRRALRCALGVRQRQAVQGGGHGLAFDGFALDAAFIGFALRRRDSRPCHE